MRRLEQVKNAMGIKDNIELPMFIDIDAGDQIPKNPNGQTVFYLINGNER